MHEEGARITSRTGRSGACEGYGQAPQTHADVFSDRVNAMVASICSVWIEPSDLLFVCMLIGVIGLLLSVECFGGMWNCIKSCATMLYAAWLWDRRCMELRSSGNEIAVGKFVVGSEHGGLVKVDVGKLHTLPMGQVA